MTHFRPFVQDKSFIKFVRFWILLIVLENTYLVQMAENGFTIFCIFETNPFVRKLFTQDPAKWLHQRSKDQMFIIHRPNYLTFHSWLLFIGGSSNFHCAMMSWDSWYQLFNSYLSIFGLDTAWFHWKSPMSRRSVLSAGAIQLCLGCLSESVRDQGLESVNEFTNQT